MAEKITPIEKFGYRFTPGAGSWNLDGYSFNPASDDEAEWKSRAKHNPSYFIDIEADKQRSAWAEKSVSQVKDEVKSIANVPQLRQILGYVTKAGSIAAIKDRIQELSKPK